MARKIFSFTLTGADRTARRFLMGIFLGSCLHAGGAPEAVPGYIRDVPPESAEVREARHRDIAARRAGIMVMVHRGASDFAPENTLEAFAAAMDHGADGCEIDIHRSRDGVLCLHHDEKLGRVFQGDGPVKDFTCFELLQYPLIKVEGTAGKDTRIPTLAALLTLARQRTMLLHLDIKEPGLDDDIAALLDASDTWDHVVHINDYHSEKLRTSPRLNLLAYKGWDHEAGQTEAAQKAFLAKPAPMVFTKGDPAKALKLIGRNAPGRIVPMPAEIHIPWTKDGPAGASAAEPPKNSAPASTPTSGSPKATRRTPSAKSSTGTNSTSSSKARTLRPL